MATVNEKMTAIADAIRDKTGETDALTLDDMATDIPKVYEAGKKSQHDEFWDNFQDYGNRICYRYGFSGHGWNEENFKPKYKIIPVGNADGMFCEFGRSPSSVSDMFDYRLVKDKIDLSQVKSGVGIFANSIFNYIDVDLSNATSLWGCFRNDWRRIYTTHIKLKVSERCTEFSAIFGYQYDLTDLIFVEGSVIARSISVSSPNLTHESLMSIINALKDYSGTTSTYTLTLHADAKAKLTESDIATITQKGWTLA